MEIEINEIYKYDNIVLIDIRSNYEYNISHMDNAINIPYYNLINNFSHYLNKNNEYYLYCNNGTKSLELSKKLNLFGYNTKSIKGGFNNFY